MRPENCPKCGVEWEEKENIYEYFVRTGYSHDDADVRARMYGCTPETPQHFAKNVVGIEISGKYDGVSLWECESCKTQFDRWTMKEVK